MIVKLFTGPLNYNVSNLYQKDESEYIIGVDQGCKLLIENGITIDLALGDFDSLSESDDEILSKHSKSIKKFESVKDYTDTFLALKEALELNHTEIVIFGGIGKRFDHTFANLNLLKLGNIKMINDTTEMYMLDPGTYEIENAHKFISFFAIEDVENLTLNGFKYELDNIRLDIDDPLCISNEGSGTLSFSKGLLLVVSVND